MDKDYGVPSSKWLPQASTDSSPQPILPAGGGIGGNPGLWEPVYKVAATITNTGDVAGSEVAQVYLALGNGEPPKVLRGFEKVAVAAGGSEEFEVELLRRDLSYWDTGAQDWVMVKEATVFVGGSSRKLPLSQDLSVEA